MVISWSSFAYVRDVCDHLLSEKIPPSGANVLSAGNRNRCAIRASFQTKQGNRKAHAAIRAQEIPVSAQANNFRVLAGDCVQCRSILRSTHKSRYSGNYILLNIRLKSSELHSCLPCLRNAEVCSMLWGVSASSRLREIAR